MAFTRKYKKFATGGFAQFSYSPKWLSQLTYYDRKPLIIFLGYDNQRKLIHGINLHWLTKEQRKRTIALVKSAMRITKDKGWPFSKPMPLDIYRLLKSKYPIATIAYRTYFPNRLRNLSFPAWEWGNEEVEEKIINTDTAKIIGVSPEQIQALARKALKSRGQTQKRKAKRRSERHKRKSR